MYKACSRCGKTHAYNYQCTQNKPKKNYRGGEERKLRSTNAWIKKSLEIREHADNLCQVCRDKGRYIYNNLEVHHIIKLKNRPDLLLENTNLIALCVPCHKQADKNELKKEYLEKLALEREEKVNTPPIKSYKT